jgi:hypothetical protein
MDASRLKDIYSEKITLYDFQQNAIQLFFLCGQQCAVIDASELKDIYSGQNNFVK